MRKFKIKLFLLDCLIVFRLVAFIIGVGCEWIGYLIYLFLIYMTIIT